MKKLVAILICSIHFSTFTWNLNFLKPNFSSWYQSWTSLPSNQQSLLIGASVLAIVYIGWPVSAKEAFDKANKEFEDMKEKAKESYGKRELLCREVSFPYGSCFRLNRPEFLVWSGECQGGAEGKVKPHPTVMLMWIKNRTNHGASRQHCLEDGNNWRTNRDSLAACTKFLS